MAQNNGRVSVVRNCTFIGNEAQYGFVAALEQNAIADTTVSDCTFSRNRGASCCCRPLLSMSKALALPSVAATACYNGKDTNIPDTCHAYDMRHHKHLACKCAAGANNGALLHQGCDKVLIEGSTFVSNTGAPLSLAL